MSTEGMNGDLFESRALRDEALERVTRPDFTQQVVDALPRMRLEVRGEFCGEDVRHWMIAHGIQPHHHNAWGGLMFGLVRRGQVVHTGYTQMKDAKSHARETKTYRWAG